MWQPKPDICKQSNKGNQLGPRYEGQLILMAEPIPHPKRPARTPSRHSSFFASDGRA